MNKTILTRITLAVIFLAIIPITMAFGPKKGFEGVINYSIELKGIPADQQAMMKSMMPTGYTVSVKDGAVRTNIDGASMSTMGMNDILSKDGKVYFMQPDQKIAYEQAATMEEMSKEEREEAEKMRKNLKKMDTQKTILGYKCQKYSLKMDDDQMGTIIFYLTDEIDLAGGNIQGLSSLDFSELGIKGMPLQIELFVQQINMIMKVTKIEEKKLDNELFAIPDDYEIKPMASLRNQLKEMNKQK